VYVPADVKDSKLRAIRRAGAEPVRIEGSRGRDRGVRAPRSARATGGGGAAGGRGGRKGDSADSAWYASHAWNPAFFEGTATVAYEIAFQRDWEAPDAVVTPLGHGTLFLGAGGFRRLKRAGWIDEVPRLFGAQAAGIAPIVRELHGADAADPESASTRPPTGSRSPSRSGSGRSSMPSPTPTATPSRSRRQRPIGGSSRPTPRRGLYTEPTCAVAPAALRELRERGVLAPNDDVVVPLTGSGLKG